jgi:hypothetical protein
MNGMIEGINSKNDLDQFGDPMIENSEAKQKAQIADHPVCKCIVYGNEI